LWGRSWKNKKVTKENHLTQKFKSELRFYLQSVVAHVDNVTEETTIDVLDDRAGADLARVGVLRLAHPLRSDLSIPFSSMKMMTSSHLVFRVDEGVIDALGAVAEVEDGVDLLSTVERLGGSNLTHALRRDIFKDLFVPKYLASEEIFSKIWLCRKLEKIFLQSVCAKKLEEIFS